MGIVFGITAQDIQTYFGGQQNPTYSISANKSAVNENETIGFTINTTNVANSTTLYWEVIGVSGTINSSDFTAAINGTATINSNTATFNLTTNSDLTTEGSESFKVRVYTGSLGGTQVAETSTITISDSSTTPVPTYSFSADKSTMNEGETVTFTVNTTNVSNGTTLYWDVTEVSGNVSPADFTAAITGTVSISNNTATFTLTAANDLTTEGTDTFKVNLRTVSANGTVVAETSNITISDTSTTPVATYSLSADKSTINENETITFTANTTNVANGTTLYWEIVGASGTVNASDFTSAITGTVTINSNTGTFQLTTNADLALEGTETFTARLHTGSVGGPQVAETSTITITDSSTPIHDTQFNRTSLLLNGEGTNGESNNAFLDSSTNNFTVSRVGIPLQGTASPFYPNWSNYFNGSSYLYTSNNANNVLPNNQNWTVECWVYLTTRATTQQLYELSSGTNTWGAGGHVFDIAILTSGYINVEYTNGTTFLANAGTTAVPLNQWSHIAIVYNGTTKTVSSYINGIVDLNGSSMSGYSPSSATPRWTIGRTDPSVTTPTNILTGYISNLRVVKGTAVYTSNFTPSTSPLTAITNTQLLTCQSNRFVDNSTNNATLTITGSPAIHKFSPFAPTAYYSTTTNGGSVYFNGTTDNLQIAANTAFNLTTGDCTIEWWHYLTSLSARTTLMSRQSSASGWGNIQWYVDALTDGSVAFVLSTGTGSANIFTTAAGLITTNNWQHISIVRQSGVWKLFVNGTSITLTNGTAYSSSLESNSTAQPLNIGGFAGWQARVTGYMSNIRIVKGTAVYTANFTIPTAPLSAITNTSLLLSNTNAGIKDLTSLNNIKTVSATVSTTHFKYGSSSMYFTGGGTINCLPSSLWNFGTGEFTIEMWVYWNGDNTGNQTLLGTGGSGSTDQFTFQPASGGLGIGAYGCGNSGYLPPANQWVHLAVCRSGTTVRLFANGVQKIATTNSSSIGNSTNIMSVGSRFDGAQPWTGYVDDLRITKGYGRYTANFTPPAEPLPLY